MAKRSVSPRLDDMIEAAERVREVLGDLSVDAVEGHRQRYWML